MPNVVISDFVSYYLTMKTGVIPVKKRLYSDFKGYVKENYEHDEEGVLFELLIYSEYYSWFINCNSPNKYINDSLQQLQQFNYTVTYPALLFMFDDCFGGNKLTEETLNNILKVILSYLYRRLICDYPTNSLKNIFKGLIEELKGLTLDDDSYYDAVVKILASRTGRGIFARGICYYC